MQIDVINEAGQVVGKADAPDELFACKVNEALLWEMVKAQRASRRRGTHSTKTRAAVRGGGAKPLKQKGSGQARQGSRRAPNHVGGGAVFGPHPRDYSYRMPRSARLSALKSALSSRAQEGNVVVLEGMELDVPSTKRVAALLEGLQVQRGLLVVRDNEALRRSTRNLAKSKCLDAKGINVYDILDHQKLILTREALSELAARVRPDELKTKAAGKAA